MHSCQPLMVLALHTSTTQPLWVTQSVDRVHIWLSSSKWVREPDYIHRVKLVGHPWSHLSLVPLCRKWKKIIFFYFWWSHLSLVPWCLHCPPWLKWWSTAPIFFLAIITHALPLCNHHPYHQQWESKLLLHFQSIGLKLKTTRCLKPKMTKAYCNFQGQSPHSTIKNIFASHVAQWTPKTTKLVAVKSSRRGDHSGFNKVGRFITFVRKVSNWRRDQFPLNGLS